MRKTFFIVLTFTLLLCASSIEAAPLTPGNIVLTSNNTVYEYTPSGTVVQSIPIAYPGGYPATEYARDLVVDAYGKISVYNGTFTPYISTYDPAQLPIVVWDQQTYPGFSTVNNGSYGGIGVMGPRIFATDMYTYNGGEPQGIVMFNGAATTRFAQNIQPIDLTVGLDGYLYALAGSNVYKYDPSSYTLLNTISLSSLPYYYDLRAIAVDRNGDIFVADWYGYVSHVDKTGALLSSIQPTCQWSGSPSSCEFLDIDIDNSGEIVLGTRFGEVIQTDHTFSKQSRFTVGSSGVFVAFDPTKPLAGISQTVAGTEDTPSPVTLSASGGTGQYTYTIATLPAHGTLSGTAPDLTYTPDQDYNGNDYFTFQVNDGLNTSNPATVLLSIAAVNDAPVASSQSVSLAEDTPTDITLSATDVDSANLTYSITIQPSHGVLSGSGDTLRYTPDPNFNGSDSFSFVANDGLLDSNEATVTLNVTAVNDPPVANPDSASTRRRRSVEIPVLANDTDVEGDKLTVVAVSNPGNGSVSISSDSQSVIYRSSGRFVGIDTFTYTVSDGHGGTATGIVTVTVTRH